ncbi:uncharacterized protein EI90DRAFT_3136254 [Cantharellus anzutake]|uniref:uncharacterized protein n=1 Tax=Cantharellus anzutake TaxID=1750568 RepID=UPI0019039C70|nr:uncharacterized protein EI90DRAFT_3136254 [Cantharellus anzutake]KAF8314139.1 hypothetical protein EI90DRAFT_3136254 [Cantharellus anzutake]
MSQQFTELACTVRNALSEFQTPNELDLQGLVEDASSFDAWVAMARSEELSNSGQLSFPKWMVPEVFPAITSSLFMVRVHWMMGHQPDDLWDGSIVSPSLRDPFAINGEPALTLQRLIEFASRLDTTSEQYRLLSNIYLCAAALKEMRDEGALKFLPSHYGDFDFSSVLLLNTTLTNPTTLPQ